MCTHDKMLTLTKRHCACLLLSACLCWDTCVGWIILCSNSQNGTSVPATLGAPASFSFCVQSNLKVHAFIRLEHSKYEIKWYPDYKEMDSKIQVQIGQQVNGLTKINITVQQVDYEDLTDVFSVKANTFNNWSDDVRFWFRLEIEAAKIINNAQSTTLRSLTTPATCRKTTEAPSCPSQENSKCPKMWYPVDDKMCLTVIDGNISSTPDQQCAVLGAHLSTETAITSMRSCLIYLLRDSVVKVISLNDTYLDVVFWGKHRSPRRYHVACLVEKQPMKEQKEPENTESEDRGGAFVGAIVGGVAGGLTLICLAVFIAIVVRTRGKGSIQNSSDGYIQPYTPPAEVRDADYDNAINLNQTPQEELRDKNHTPEMQISDINQAPYEEIISHAPYEEIRDISHAPYEEIRDINHAQYEEIRDVRFRPPDITHGITQTQVSNIPHEAVEYENTVTSL